MPPDGEGRSRFLLANDRLEFRACVAEARANEDGTASVQSEAASALGLKTDDSLWLSPPQ